MIFNGMRVISTPMLTKAGDPIKVKRSWIDRLFSIPWKPLISYRYQSTQVPSREVIVDKVNNCIYCHPVIFKEIEILAKEQSQ